MLAARPRALTTYLHINPMRNLRIFTDEDLVTSFKLHNSPDSNSCSCFSVLIYSLTSDCLGFSGSSDGKEFACNAGDPGSILGREDALEKGMATHSSTLAWRISWTEEFGKLQSMGLQKKNQT